MTPGTPLVAYAAVTGAAYAPVCERGCEGVRPAARPVVGDSRHTSGHTFAPNSGQNITLRATREVLTGLGQIGAVKAVS